MTNAQNDEAVTVGEEIQCLLAAGWTWDGDKLVHPTSKDVWTTCKRTFSHASRTGDFDREVKEAVRKARQQGRLMEGNAQ
jgi:hypothetical protein